MQNNTIMLFLYTVEEYKKFFDNPNHHNITDSYDNISYFEINIKLMLLRKYGCETDNVHIKKVINAMLTKYPKHKGKLEKLLNEYNKIEEQNIEFILSDGTKLSLYNTIEDTMYGLYLHADYDRIKRLMTTDENLRFPCVRTYVEELEIIVFKLYDFIKECGETIKIEKNEEKAQIIYLGASSHNKQEIKKSSYWSNLYGRDGTDEDLEKILNEMTDEDSEVLNIALKFLDELEQDDNEIALDNLIYPATKKDWKNYSTAKIYYRSINHVGLSPRVRYNKTHTMAYVKIFPNVEDFFIIETPHITNKVREICLVKDDSVSNWKVFSIGDHIDNYILNN